MPADAEARLVLKGVDEATPTIRKTKNEMEGLDDATKEVAASTAESNLAFLATASALSQLSGGYDQIVTSMKGLNLVSDETARILEQMGYFMKLFVGTAQMIQGVIGLINALRASETALAVVQAFRTALIPFIGVVLVGAALAATAIVGAKLAGWFQTSPGESRTVRESGPAYVHKGETISRGGGSSKTIHVHINGGGQGRQTLYEQYMFARRVGKEVAKA